MVARSGIKSPKPLASRSKFAQANAALSEAAGLPAACLAKLLACAGMGRAAKP